MADAPVLVVDDEPDIRLALIEVLELEGYPVEVASNGRDALHIVEVAPPGLVILDLNMPVLDGWGFARAVQERGHDIPIVVMTAGQSARVAARELGAVGYLMKPFDMDGVLSLVQRFRRAPELDRRAG